MLIKLFVLSVFLFASGCDSGDRSSSLLGLGLKLTEQQRYFVINYAAFQQELFLVNLDDPEAVLAYNVDLLQKMDCVHKQFNDDILVAYELITKIADKTLNTKKRKNASEEFDNATPLVIRFNSDADKCVRNAPN